MPVTALSQRAGRPTAPPAGPGRTGGSGRRQAPIQQPAVTVTVAIPLAGQALTPHARRLLEVVRDLVEAGEGVVSLDSSTMEMEAAVSRQPAARDAAREPAPAGGVPRPTRATRSAPGEIQLLAASRQALLDGRPLPLTRLEFELLLFLAEHPRRVFTRVQLLSGVWGYEHTGVRTIDVHIRRLRAKVGSAIPLITTVYGVGYRLADDARVVVVGED